MFKRTEWNASPAAATMLKDGRYMVARKVEAIEREGVTVYAGELAIMTETQYAAYIGAKEVAERREAEIIDDYTLQLIEEGVI